MPRPISEERLVPSLLALVLALGLALGLSACGRGDGAAPPPAEGPTASPEGAETAPTAAEPAADSPESAPEDEPEDGSFTGTYALATDPEAPERIWFTLERGIMASEDGGRGWTALQQSKVEPTQRVGALGFGAGGRAYMAGEGVFRRSDDEGQTWEDVPELAGEDVLGLLVLPEGPLLATVHERGLLRSEDGGDSWTSVAEALPAEAVWGLWALDAEASRIAMYDRGAERLLVSEDGGETWEDMDAEGLESRVMHMAASPEGSIYAATNGGLLASEDGGETWEARGPFQMIAAVAVPAEAPEALLVVAPGGQVYRSPDGGRSWGGDGTDEDSEGGGDADGASDDAGDAEQGDEG